MTENTAAAVRSEEAPAYAIPAVLKTDEARTRAMEDRVIAQAIEILDSRIVRGVAMVSPQDSGRYAKLRLQGYEHEVFACLFMDTRHRLIAWEEMFRGTVDGAEVHPREVVKAALKHNAAAVICAHNHPSGSPEPSAADRAVTLRLKTALALVDVRLLDHFVIGDGAPVSLAARGWV